MKARRENLKIQMVEE
jgi:dynein regulatory complex subunit 2